MMKKYQYLSFILAMGLVGCQTSGPVVNYDNLSTEIKKDPQKSIQARTQLAAEHIKAGDLDAAKRSLDQALKIDSRDTMANMMMGILLQAEGSPTNLAKADQYFRTAISSDSKNAQVRANYGTYLFQMKRYHQAIENLTIAGTTLGYEQRSAALETLGYVYLAMNNTAKAEEAFKQSLRADRSGSPRAYMELAEIFYLKQDFNNAAAAYEQFTRMIGNTQKDARSLWVGVRIARAFNDKTKMQILVNEMRALYPDSPEYQRYLQLKNSSEVVWK